MHVYTTHNTRTYRTFQAIMRVVWLILKMHTFVEQDSTWLAACRSIGMAMVVIYAKYHIICNNVFANILC